MPATYISCRECNEPSVGDTPLCSAHLEELMRRLSPGERPPISRWLFAASVAALLGICSYWLFGFRLWHWLPTIGSMVAAYWCHLAIPFWEKRVRYLEHGFVCYDCGGVFIPDEEGSHCHPRSHYIDALASILPFLRPRRVQKHQD